VFTEDKVEVLSEVAQYVAEFRDSGGRIAVVTGGGETARRYIRMGSSIGLSKSWQDVLGINSARLNALLMAALLDDSSYLPIPRSIDDFLQGWATGKVVVMGGLQPGQSTNAVAAAIAELVNADILINATVVDGVYDKDPEKYSDAKLMKKVSISQLKKYLKQSYLPGKYELLDPIALNIVERSCLKVIFLNALKPHLIQEALKGNYGVGTLLTHEENQK